MQIVWYRLSEIYKEFLDIIIVGWRSLIITVGEWTGRLSLFNIPSKFYSVYVLLWLHNYVRKRRAVDRARCCGWLCHVNGCRLLFHFFDIRASTYTVLYWKYSVSLEYRRWLFFFGVIYYREYLWLFFFLRVHLLNDISWSINSLLIYSALCKSI